MTQPNHPTAPESFLGHPPWEASSATGSRPNLL
jgi:hypothetical protein